MISVNLAWVLIVGEILLLLSAALLTLLVVNANRRRRDRQAARYLVGVVKDNEALRLADTREFLREVYGYRDEELERHARDIVHAEKTLFQRVINMYVRRDVISLREFNIDVEAVTEPLRGLRPAGASSTPIQGEASDGGDPQQQDALKAENEALKTELKITMETMSRMLNEYASMFGTDSSGQEAAGAALPEPTPSDFDREEAEAAIDAEQVGAATSDPAVRAEDVEGLDELSGFDTVVAEPLRETGQSNSDATVVLTKQSGPADGTDLAPEGIDLMGDEFGAADADNPPAASAAADEPTDEELADIWAEALAEQEAVEEKR
jgi:hypothetical protein